MVGAMATQAWFQSALAPKDERYDETKLGLTLLDEFQSALAPKDERYPSVTALLLTMASFNPLSPRRTRDTVRVWHPVRLRRVSIRSRPEGREIR